MKDWPLSRPDTALRTPASKRISSPVSDRLRTITEDRHPRKPPAIPPKSILRQSTSTLSLPRSIIVTPPDDRSSDKYTTLTGTTAAAPSSYEWVPEPRVVDDESVVSGPVEGEKLAEFRRSGGHRRRQTRGGSRRVLLLVILVFVIVVGLAVGLGVGLTVGKHHDGTGSSGSSSSGASGSGNSTNEPDHQPFPLGQYTMLTALTNVSTDCTSNTATWSCYPRTIYNPSSPSSGGLATFDWILSNTSSIYATMASAPTSDQGIPANISVSSTNNPLSISFTDRPMTYIATASNSSSARLTFSFTMSKSVFPATSLTSDNVAAQCFFNQTVFTGTLYLSAPRDYPPSNSTGTGLSGVSSKLQWPYAIEVTQSSAGGDSTPACYEYVNGVNGNRITTGLTAESATSQCSCEYRNF